MVKILLNCMFLWRDSNDKPSASRSLGRLSSREAKTSRRERVLLSTLIAIMDPPKDTEKYITDDKVVRSNIKLVNCMKFFVRPLCPICAGAP